MAKREPGEKWNCSACGQLLVGARTVNGKVAPIEVSLNAREGRSFLFRRGDEIRVAELTEGPVMEFAKAQGFEIRRNHFIGCPHAERFRTQRAKPAEGEESVRQGN